MEADILDKVVQAIAAGDFRTATMNIANVREDDELHDEVLGCLVNLFSRGDTAQDKITDIVKQISVIYDQNKDDHAQLKNKFNSLLAQAGVAQSQVPIDQALGDLSSWTDKQLDDRLDKLKKEQQNLLSSGKDMDKIAGKLLNQLLEEQSKRLGYKGKQMATEKKVTEGIGQEAKPEGADEWFVVPTVEELAQIITTRVVCGSPIITILRERYKQEYKIKKILDVSLSTTKNLSGDEEYEIKRELNRQIDFVSDYSEPGLILDQDMCAYSIASEFLTEKYEKPELIRVDDELSCHLFKSGFLKDFFTRNSMLHNFSIEGNVVGRFAICLNRKEPASGRFISDAYDILEFQDGKPSLYFCSAKGVSSLSASVLKEMKMARKDAKHDLHIPNPVAPGNMASREELEKFIQEQKGKANEEVMAQTELETENINSSNTIKEVAIDNKKEIIPTTPEPKAVEPVENAENQIEEEPEALPEEGISTVSEPEETTENEMAVHEEEVQEVETANEAKPEEETNPTEEANEPPAVEEETVKDETEDRINRLEQLVLNSAETLDKMEKQIAKVSEFIAAKKTQHEPESEPIDGTINEEDEKQMFKRRAEAIKEAIRKKKEVSEAQPSSEEAPQNTENKNEE